MCHGGASVLLDSGILALVSLVEGACTLVLLLLYACVPAWPQLFLCIIDGKVRIAEVMRWEGAAKRQGGRVQSWEGDRVRRAAKTRSRGEGIWSNRSWHWAGGTCQHAVSLGVFHIANTAWLKINSSVVVIRGKWVYCDGKHGVGFVIGALYRWLTSVTLQRGANERTPWLCLINNGGEKDASSGSSCFKAAWITLTFTIPRIQSGQKLKLDHSNEKAIRGITWCC